MSRFYGVSSYGGFFGNSGFGSMSSIYGGLSQYSSVKSGAYAKALRSYYSKQTNGTKGTTSTQKSSKTQNSYRDELLKKVNSAKVDTTSTTLSDVKTKAEVLQKSADKLMNTGKNSLFADVDQYDKDAAYQAVSDFAKNYNETLDAVKKADNSRVTSSGSTMSRMTNVMKNSLAQVGVTVGDDGKLSVDEMAFKNADISKVKSMFNGSGSYAGIVSSSASRVESQAAYQMNRSTDSYAGLYGRSGYYNSFLSGSYFNAFF